MTPTCVNSSHRVALQLWRAGKPWHHWFGSRRRRHGTSRRGHNDGGAHLRRPELSNPWLAAGSRKGMHAGAHCSEARRKQPLNQGGPGAGRPVGRHREKRKVLAHGLRRQALQGGCDARRRRSRLHADQGLTPAAEAAA